MPQRGPPKAAVTEGGARVPSKAGSAPLKSQSVKTTAGWLTRKKSCSVKSAPTYSVSSQCSGVVTRPPRTRRHTRTAAAESTRRPADRPDTFGLPPGRCGRRRRCPGEQDARHEDAGDQERHTAVTVNAAAASGMTTPLWWWRRSERFRIPPAFLDVVVGHVHLTSPRSPAGGVIGRPGRRLDRLAG